MDIAQREVYARVSRWKWDVAPEKERESGGRRILRPRAITGTGSAVGGQLGAGILCTSPGRVSRQQRQALAFFAHSPSRLHPIQKLSGQREGGREKKQKEGWERERRQPRALGCFTTWNCNSQKVRFLQNERPRHSCHASAHCFGIYSTKPWQREVQGSSGARPYRPYVRMEHKKVNPKCLSCPLVAGRSIGHKSHLLNVSR